MEKEYPQQAEPQKIDGRERPHENPKPERDRYQALAFPAASISTAWGNMNRWFRVTNSFPCVSKNRFWLGSSSSPGSSESKTPSRYLRVMCDQSRRHEANLENRFECSSGHRLNRPQNRTETGPLSCTPVSSHRVEWHDRSFPGYPRPLRPRPPMGTVIATFEVQWQQRPKRPN